MAWKAWDFNQIQPYYKQSFLLSKRFLVNVKWEETRISRASAILQLGVSFEVFIKTICDILSIQPDHFLSKTLRNFKKGYRRQFNAAPPNMPEIRQMINDRNSAAHAARAPEPLFLIAHLDNVRAFYDEVFSKVFARSFSSLDFADLLRSSELRNQLLRTNKALNGPSAERGARVRLFLDYCIDWVLAQKPDYLLSLFASEIKRGERSSHLAFDTAVFALKINLNYPGHLIYSAPSLPLEEVKFELLEFAQTVESTYIPTPGLNIIIEGNPVEIKAINTDIPNDDSVLYLMGRKSDRNLFQLLKESKEHNRPIAIMAPGFADIDPNSGETIPGSKFLCTEYRLSLPNQPEMWLSAFKQV
ncbi:MAG: hypothetical protein ACE5OZ_18325 [Candidatus Heimdallarchaeota archaeon]